MNMEQRAQQYAEIQKLEGLLAYAVALETALKAGFAYGGLVPKGRLSDQYLARFIEDQFEGSDSKCRRL